MSPINYNKYKGEIREKMIKQSQNFIIKDNKAYDLLTGEDISHLYQHQWLIPVMNKVTINSKKAFKSLKILGEHEAINGQFVFAFFTLTKSITDMFPDIKKPDIARLMYLGTLIEWESGILKTGNGKATVPVMRSNFHEVVKLSKNRSYTLLNQFIENKVLIENVHNELVMNKELFYRGRKENFPVTVKDKKFTRMFRKTVQDLFNNADGRQLSSIANIYMVLPFLNLHTNIVSHNPDETDIDKIIPMTLGELSDVLGYKDYRKLKTTLNNVKIDDEYAFGFFFFDKDKRSMKIVVNPDIVFAGDGEQLGLVKLMFNKNKPKH